MKEVENQKLKLIEKKNRIALEETKLKLKERKMRTRYLIELGGLIVKAELGNLNTNTLFGALISLKNSLNQAPEIKSIWTKIGKDIFDKEANEKSAIILKFKEKPDKEIRNLLRNFKLKWNSFREEWYGEVIDFTLLKEALENIKYDIEIIK